MASAMNHRRRSHRSDKFHRACLHGMKQFLPRNLSGMGLLRRIGRAARNREK